MRMASANQTVHDESDPNLAPESSGFANPNNVIKKFYCNRRNLFGNFSQAVSTTNAMMNVQPYQDPNALVDCPENDQASIAQILGAAAAKVGPVSSITCNHVLTNKTMRVILNFNT